MTLNFSKPVGSPLTEQLFTFEYAALMTETSITLVKIYVELGIVEAKGNRLHTREISRIAQLEKARQNLGQRARYGLQLVNQGSVARSQATLQI